MTGQAKSRSNGTSIDRSRVKMLLCDRNPESCEEVSTLLTTCCYQGTYVRTYLDQFNPFFLHYIAAPCVLRTETKLYFVVLNTVYICNSVLFFRPIPSTYVYCASEVVS